MLVFDNTMNVFGELISLLQNPSWEAVHFTADSYTKYSTLPGMGGHDDKPHTPVFPTELLCFLRQVVGGLDAIGLGKGYKVICLSLGGGGGGGGGAGAFGRGEGNFQGTPPSVRNTGHCLMLCTSYTST